MPEKRIGSEVGKPEHILPYRQPILCRCWSRLKAETRDLYTGYLSPGTRSETPHIYSMWIPMLTPSQLVPSPILYISIKEYWSTILILHRRWALYMHIYMLPHIQYSRSSISFLCYRALNLPICYISQPLQNWTPGINNKGPPIPESETWKRTCMYTYKG